MSRKVIYILAGLALFLTISAGTYVFLEKRKKAKRKKNAEALGTLQPVTTTTPAPVIGVSTKDDVKPQAAASSIAAEPKILMERPENQPPPRTQKPVKQEPVRVSPKAAGIETPQIFQTKPAAGSKVDA